MSNHLVALNELPPDGKIYDISDPDVWLRHLQEFHMDCGIREPLNVRAHVIPAQDGFLIRGRLRGQVVMPCSRCAGDAPVRIDDTFEEFEPLPEERNGIAADDTGETSNFDACAAVRLHNNTYMLDLAAICWEEFMLALPVSPLCKPDCKGLCAKCGANLNEGDCGCRHDERDPRLAALQGLILPKT